MSRFEAPRKLLPSDDLGDFCCGVSLVDEWTHARVHSAEKNGTGVVYVVCADGRVAGIYSLCSHAVARDEVDGGWLRRNTPEAIPAILLGMLGVDKRYQGERLGSSLLKDAIQRSLFVAEQIGAKALLVDPVDRDAARFYEKCGFARVPGTSRMFLPLKR